MALPITGLSGGISDPSVPSVPSMPGASSLGSISKPSTVVKIDTQTGVGVPGGFSGGSNIKPTSMLSKLQSAQSAISSAKAKVVAALNSGQKGVTASSLNKLNGMQSSVSSKMKAAQQAPDFQKYQPILPKPVDMPSTPNFQSAGIYVPSTPSVPTTPNVQSTSMPSLAAGTSVPSSLSTPSGVSIPTPPKVA
jgi:hypothetical protein